MSSIACHWLLKDKHKKDGFRRGVINPKINNLRSGRILASLSYALMLVAR